MSPEISLDEYKAKLQTLKTRAEALDTQTASLTREATIQEQKRETAVQALAELGYKVEGLNSDALDELAETLRAELKDAVKELDESVTEAEQLVAEARATA